ncbi:TPA: macrodomain Ter protein MatP [Photobacterium damselae]|uniref:Macrodomain Ter protein n=3 Tax=Photobacterium damselae TaxID=38293 RepID=A0A850R2F7_PHODD|nr:macrodomain Ter protein MatP [Photobacterium damselae]EHA1079441.1 macrodomain Ter protein MatP [Photobacterium damselae]ELV7517398.1 macrodomain Ter protein MatP [Photobacterium damselae]KAB1180562.1 macrodomain Ter protein MatP [Photobacterium damselae subsp. damselae]KAB1182032.1 macrodomain Ter protein MatP [Photobacterium damselae subsp. damselae]MBA5682119.1 macrodomain Ter protein MatP [Photobacterium damselae subsp. damselae]
MKYQQLENLEAGWKWAYLVKKWKEGEAVTRYIDTSEVEAAVEQLQSLEHEPTKVLTWIDNHMSPALEIKLKQAIRAKRKRHFNAEQVHTRKKSIDLDYRVWEKLAEKSKELDSTLSDTIEYLLSESSRTEKASKTVLDLKDDLTRLLDMDA